MSGRAAGHGASSQWTVADKEPDILPLYATGHECDLVDLTYVLMCMRYTFQ